MVDPTPDVRDLEGRIVFQSRSQDASGITIFIMNADGSGMDSLRYQSPETDQAVVIGPRLSPDGTRIAFIHDGQVWVMNDDGSNAQQLTSTVSGDPGHTASHPSWSPDGTKIVFSAWGTNSLDLFVVDADGTSLTQLTETLFSSELYPEWSPNGQRIAYGTRTSQIRTIDESGSDDTPVTEEGVGQKAAWSPTGDRLAIQGDREILVVNFDGSGLTVISNHPAWDRSPTWSPNGHWIAFSSDRANTGWAIFAMRPDGSDVIQITDAAPGSYGSPHWGR